MSRDDGVQVEHPRLEHLLAAEGQELLGERRGPLAGLLDLLEVVPWLRVLGVERSQQELAVAQMTVSRLLKSWATPPASRPTASIFCACRSFS